MSCILNEFFFIWKTILSTKNDKITWSNIKNFTCSAYKCLIKKPCPLPICKNRMHLVFNYVKNITKNHLGGKLFQLAEFQPNWPNFGRHLAEDHSNLRQQWYVYITGNHYKPSRSSSRRPINCKNFGGDTVTGGDILIQITVWG